MKIRLLALVMLLVLIAGIVPFAAAQDTPDPKQQFNCLGLSADDCAIVQASMDNMNNINSASPTVKLSLAVAGVGAMAPGMAADTTVDVQATGAVVVDHEALKSDTPYKGVAAAFDVTGSGGGDSGPLNLSFVLVDGIIYLKDSTGTWKGVAIEDLKNHPEAAQALMGSMPNMSFMGMDMSSGMMDGMMGQGMMGQGMMGQMGTLSPESTPDPMLMNLLQMPGFLSQTRLADETMMGQTMQVFAYTADLATALQSPDLQQAMSGMMMGGADGAAPGGMGGQMGMMIPALLQSTTGTVTLTRWIGADDQFIHQVSLVVDAQIDLFGGAAATSPKMTPLPPITIKLDATLSLDKINDTAAPTAPEGATILSADDLMAMEATPEATPAQ